MFSDLCRDCGDNNEWCLDQPNAWAQEIKETMWLALAGQLILGFVVGTLVLWVCSYTVNTQNANLRTSAIYNAVMTAMLAVLFGMGLGSLASNSTAIGTAFIVATVITVVVSFILLMRLYAISFLSTIWLVIAMWAVQTGVEKLINWVF